MSSSWNFIPVLPAAGALQPLSRAAEVRRCPGCLVPGAEIGWVGIPLGREAADAVPRGCQSPERSASGDVCVLAPVQGQASDSRQQLCLL